MSANDAQSVELLLTVFSADWQSPLTLDLTRPPLDRDRRKWTHPDDYGPTRQLALSARVAGVEVIRYESVRDIEGGINVALLSPSAFSRPDPAGRQTWRLFLSRHEANCERVDVAGRARRSFTWT